MARLPSAQDLGIRSFQDRSQVVTPTANVGGQNQLVATISNISTGMNERLDATSRHKAKVHFQKAKIEADAAFDQDPDFETYQERYDKKIQAAIEASAAMVRNPNDRAMFQQEMSLYKAQGTQAIIAKAYGKEVDRGLADLDETLTIGRENYLRASNEQDKAFAMDAINDAINAVEGATYIDADKAQSMRQRVALDLAVASVESAPPEKQIELLKSSKGVMQYLPLDVRTKMMKNAEVQLGAQIALDTANTIRTEGGTLDERLAKVHKIKDPKVKSATKSQVINDHNLELTADGQAKYAIYDGMAKELLVPGGRSIAQIIKDEPKQWNSLGSKEQEALISRATTGKPQKTDPTVYRELSNKKNESTVKAYHYYLENISSFSPEEQKRQDDIFQKLSGAPKPLRSIEQEFNKRIGQLGVKVKDDDWALADQRLNDEYDSWTKNNPGETMDANTQKLILDGIFDEVVIPGTWWGTNTVKGFEAPKLKVDQERIKKEVERHRVERNGGKEVPIEMQAAIEMALHNRGLISPPEVK